VVIFDLRGRSPVTEFFVIATGTSPRQMRTVVDELQDLGKTMGFAAWQTSGYESARWIVLDCVNVVIHVFDAESRDFYDLDLLWGDAPRINWRKQLGLPPETERPEGTLRARPDEEPEDDAELPRESEDQPDDEPLVEIEIPDESTGSNSVEFLEVDPPAKQRQRGRVRFPTPVEEPEDTTEEERAVEPMSEAANAAEEIEEEEEAAAALTKKPAKKAKAKKPAARKKPAKKAVKAGKAKQAAAKKKPAAKKRTAKSRKKA
jgi:ribosome-associated protein